MAISITIENLDEEVVDRLRAEAQRRGVDLSELVRELVGNRLVTRITEGDQPPYHDLDALAGTWSQEQAETFLSSVAVFGRVDEDIWK
ncbi:MAG: ribbon-helix-helix protein, CopG family [Candidatus Nealsonbacteria bacterium]|nr:ribbon-helix-helix protein, CopG family [Candidatus Nealsonbacteria bacterium]